MKKLFLTITLTIAAIALTNCGTATNKVVQNSDSMSDMKSSPNAASQPFDLQFIDTMSHHHQMAIEMAQTAVKKASRPELKAFAQKIIADQTKEITQMQQWRDQWFKDKPMAMNMEMPGMTSSMPNMDAAMKKLETAGGKEFDAAFLDAMTPHHAGAVEMAKDALTKAERPEIKTLAQNIIKAQDEEIKQMQSWKAAWNK